MSVILRTSADLPPADSYGCWFAAADAAPDLAPERRCSGIPAALEEGFEAGRAIWWEMGRTLSDTGTIEISHAGACASFGSDLGLMLAWEDLVDKRAAMAEMTLAVCDDPWLFRHLATRPGVAAGRPPPLRRRELGLAVRGYLSRCRLALRSAAAALGLRRFRSPSANGAPAILVYGHPGSARDGRDAYFGDLMLKLPELHRVLHVDCAAARARTLCSGGRTASLHAWGSPLFALIALPWQRWRPRTGAGTAGREWLVRRAAALENGGGGPANVRWQTHCQERWLRSARPRAIAWPWENFSWERNLVRSARRRSVPTVGYIHTVVGGHQFNFCVRCNADGLASVPDLVAVNGPAYRDELTDWGMPDARLVDGGAFRMSPPRARPEIRADAPVFLSLSGGLKIAARQIATANRLSEHGFDLLVKEHPMYPVAFEETARLRRTDRQMAEQPALSAVLYATGAIALECLMAGVPCVRQRFEDRVSINVLPRKYRNPVADDAEIAECLGRLPPPPAVRWEDLYSAPDVAVWADLLKTNRISSI